MVMAALTALKSTNFDFGIFLLWLFGCEELCGSRIELHPKASLSALKKT
jgi:hypothetical protein